MSQDRTEVKCKIPNQTKRKTNKRKKIRSSGQKNPVFARKSKTELLSYWVADFLSSKNSAFFFSFRRVLVVEPFELDVRSFVPFPSVSCQPFLD